MGVEDIIKYVLKYKSDADVDLIRKAYRFAKKIYGNKRRISGATQINHVLQVADQLTKIKSDEKTIITALLHEVSLDRENIRKIKNDFGEEILKLIEGMSKVKRIKTFVGKKYDSVGIRKMLLAATSDIRILLIKLCNKICNMRSMNYLSKDEQVRISQEVLDIYAPLASKLGVRIIKNELEDLALKYLHPEEYRKINKKLAESKLSREKRTNEIIKIVEKELKKEGIKAEVQGRIKHIYSIYSKIHKRDYSFERMKDIVGIRIITGNVEECYKVLGIIHRLFFPISESFKDYIAMPKPNGYQSLHTAVIGPSKKTVEFQIRTKEMHEIAEEGVAAHTRYKGIEHGKQYDKQLSLLKEIMEKDGSLGKINLDFFSDEIFVFTPKGKIIELPIGSCPVDFAYAIHTDVGHRCMGAYINGRFVNLRTLLNNGDMIEIVTQRNHQPSREWLKFVASSRAKEKIRQALRKAGKEVIRAVKRPDFVESEEEEKLIGVESSCNLPIKTAVCCKPLPGDGILGYKRITMINIHRKDCSKVGRIKKENLVKAYWKDPKKAKVEIVVEALDRVGIFSELLNVVSKLNLKIEDAKAKSVSNLVLSKFSVSINGIKDCEKVISSLRKIKSVKSIYFGKVSF